MVRSQWSMAPSAVVVTWLACVLQRELEDLDAQLQTEVEV